MTAHSKTNVEEYESALSDCHYRSANHLLKLCRDNGGVFIKVGQHIGALEYLLPEEYVSTMKVLHNRAPEMELKQIYAVIREDLKREVIRNTHQVLMMGSNVLRLINVLAQVINKPL